MRLKYGIISAIIFFSSCFSTKPSKIHQNLSGYIYRVSGNQMPGPGRQSGQKHGVSRNLFIYEATTTKNTSGDSPLFTRITTHLVARTKSDSAGHYTVQLPPGKYSVFIMDGTNFFAAESNSEGILNPVEITGKAFVQQDFTLSANAVY